MYNRHPLPRVNGKYIGLDGLDDYAEKVAHELVNMYPDIDTVDIQFLFEAKFGYHMAVENMCASAETI